MYKIIIFIVATVFLFMACAKVNNSNIVDDQTEEVEEQNQDTVEQSEFYNQIENTILNLPVEELNEYEISSMLHMREEEKLARDVYDYLYSIYQMRIFTNINASESLHMFAVKVLLNKYNIDDPADSSEPGVFKNDELQGIYNMLIERGKISLTEALTVGVIIEDLDIYDLNDLLKSTDNKDFKYVFENLNLGSRNHLRAFYPQLLDNNGEYFAKYISQEEFDAILSSSKEFGAW